MSLAGEFLQEVWAHGLPDDMAIELRLIGSPTKSAWRAADQLALVPDPVSQDGTATFSVCAGAAGSGGAMGNGDARRSTGEPGRRAFRG